MSQTAITTSPRKTGRLKSRWVGKMTGTKKTFWIRARLFSEKDSKFLQKDDVKKCRR